MTLFASNAAQPRVASGAHLTMPLNASQNQTSALQSLGLDSGRQLFPRGTRSPWSTPQEHDLSRVALRDVAQFVPGSLEIQGRLVASSACRAIRIDRSKIRKEEDAIQSPEDLELCPVDCVREIKTKAELDFVVRWGKESGTLVIVDFFRTACGSCNYIAIGFAKLCRVEGDQQMPVLFFKHNIMDEYEQVSDIAEELKIKAVPLFHVYKEGELVEAFHTRDKGRILQTIEQHVGAGIHEYLA